MVMDLLEEFVLKVDVERLKFRKNCEIEHKNFVVMFAFFSQAYQLAINCIHLPTLLIFTTIFITDPN